MQNNKEKSATKIEINSAKYVIKCGLKVIKSCSEYPTGIGDSVQDLINFLADAGEDVTKFQKQLNELEENNISKKQ